MRKVALVLSLAAMMAMGTTSCKKEKTCVCTVQSEDANGDPQGDATTNETTVKSGSCSDLNKTEDHVLDDGKDVTTCVAK